MSGDIVSSGDHGERGDGERLGGIAWSGDNREQRELERFVSELS